MNRSMWIFRNRVSIFSLIGSFYISALHGDDAFPHSSRSLAIDAMNEFSSHQNWIFSPLSADAVLSMLYAGSGGRTAEELKQALHLSLTQNDVGTFFQNFSQDLEHIPSNERDFQLRIVQGIWSQKGFPFLDEFITSMRDEFRAQIESIDFSLPAIDRINHWISDQTEHKIINLFNPGDLNSSTRLVLANAIYFKGKWINGFNSDLTIPALFTLSKDETKEVEMMRQFSQFKYFEDSDWQAVILPFDTAHPSHAEPTCLLLLSKHNDDAHHLTDDKLEEILASFSRRMVHLQIPKFKLEHRIDLQNWLERKGVSDSFSPQADFSKMNGRMDLFLSKVVQKCFFSLDEHGVEAVAATGAAMNAKCCRPTDEETVAFIADRPFEFLLIDQASRTCLMTGHIADPLQ